MAARRWLVESGRRRWPIPSLPEHEDTFWEGVAEAGRFFMGQADVQVALERLARALDEMGIPYAIVGALALNEWAIGG